ncbi:hypothetical protein GOP47_0009378 [Adiantum capillus-veneris]|uniref:BTB domain-containing protein n=1 Tax=Adiantum capillus-veneris TaxID=13818 RepID=A0A9D4UWZ7_ADICA|nr:hypothetical protein GOP47_0009378 [Adiantum capillus-veneris]
MPCASSCPTITKTYRNLLVVPPFECAWLVDDNLRFPEPGRGCVAFEACADNDVTVVLKEKAGSKHYRTDMDPNYAIVLGSHRNRRLRIAVDGSTLFEAAGVVVSPSHFERFWISICDGHITVGKGDPGRGVLFEWAHSDTTRKVQYVGLSSWDKHVGYRNIRVLPYSKSLPLSSRLAEFALASGGVAQFLESSEFADLYFCVGLEMRLVPAHRLVLACCCSKSLPSKEDVISLPSVEYCVLHAFLQYAYTGRAQLARNNLAALRQICEQFGLDSLSSQCETPEQIDDSIASKSCLNLEYNHGVEGSLEASSAFSDGSPIDSSKLQAFFGTSELTDLEIMLDGCHSVIRVHKIVLSAWSHPLLKMFTNGMWESSMAKICIRDVQLDVFTAMLEFMYSGHLNLGPNDKLDSLLLSLLVLADQFGIPLLQHACSLKLIELLSKESVSSILRVAASLPCCELLQDACVEFFAKHFEDCIQHSSDVQELDLSFLRKIIESSDLSVATEESVLNTMILWASADQHLHDWRGAEDYLSEHSVVELFGERLISFDEMLQYVRFALMPPTLLQELKASRLSESVPRLRSMVYEALEYLAPDKEFPCCERRLFLSNNICNQDRLVQLAENSIQFSQRSSKLKELFFICDGDSNGVLYYAGTSHGAHAWMNPALTKKVSVTASSPLSRFTDAKALVSRQYQGTSFAGPSFEGGHPCSWWKIDLGESHQLMCNHYTLRQDGSVNYVRSWSLQGSSDDRNWLDLRIHQNEKTLSRAGQFASWPIHSANAHLPFRYFRIILTGPTSSSSRPWNLCICYTELYGYLKNAMNDGPRYNKMFGLKWLRPSTPVFKGSSDSETGKEH